jgi:hypothetical protein
MRESGRRTGRTGGWICGVEHACMPGTCMPGQMHAWADAVKGVAEAWHAWTATGLACNCLHTDTCNHRLHTDMCSHGTATYENGSMYVGDFEGDARSGWGVQRFGNGDQYEGQWSADKITGKHASACLLSIGLH